MKKAARILIMLSAIFAAAYTFAYFYPVEYALSMDNLPREGEYILVTPTETTEACWKMIGDNNRIFKDEEIKNVHLIGNTPLVKYSADINFVMGENNTFLCYCTYVGMGHFAFLSKLKGTDEFEVYDVTDCRIIAPIHTDNIIPMPKEYINALERVKGKCDNYDVAISGE